MTEQIREAVQIVLTRMETHPEDFYDDMRINSRFAWVWNVLNSSVSYGLNEAEIDALKQGFDKLMYRKFHDRVLESLLSESEEEKMLSQQGSSLKYKPVQYTDPRSIYGSIGQSATAQSLQNAAMHNAALNSSPSVTSFAGVINTQAVNVGKQTLTEALVQKLKNL